MSKILIFIGQEKVISNLLKYNFFDSFFSHNLITLTTPEILKKYPFLPNPITFQTNWKKQDIRLFHLHLLICNYIMKNNRGLYYDLRAFILGPYKIKSISTFIKSAKFLKQSLFEIKFLFILKKYRSNPTDILIGLRKKHYISNGDVINFKKVLKRNKISKVISISSFRDPKLFDLAIASSTLNLETHVFVECWDNISTGYGVPKGISNLYLWSEQQLRDFYNFNSMSSTKSFVSGGYRISHAKNYLKIKSKIDKDYQSDTLKILYLQGYFYENLNFAIAKIISSIMAVKSKNRVFPNIKIIVRKYPLKRQSIQKEIGLKYQNLNTNLDQEFLEVSNSNNISIDIDLSEADLVISELTTAGLEAAFRKIPVIFVGSNSSIRFLDSMAGYNYSFAKDIPLLFNLINLSKETDLELLKKLIYSLIFLNDETYNLKSKLLLNDSDLELFGKPFELNLWYKLIN